MKSTHQCTKCNSYLIYIIKGTSFTPQLTLNSWGKTAKIDKYVCGDCGFIEEYIQVTPKLRAWFEEKTGEQGGGGYDGMV